MAVMREPRPRDEARSPQGGRPYGEAGRGEAAAAGLRKD
jgi:hypothetical protein